MSGNTTPVDPWAPVQHMDAPPPEKPKPKPKPKPVDPKPPKGDEPTTLKGMPTPMAMSLLIPPDFIAAVSNLAGAMAAHTAEMAKMTAAMAEQSESLEAAMMALGMHMADAIRDVAGKPDSGSNTPD
jgi:hypothetical protein